jgi:hypothetical protein
MFTVALSERLEVTLKNLGIDLDEELRDGRIKASPLLFPLSPFLAQANMQQLGSLAFIPTMPSSLLPSLPPSFLYPAPTALRSPLSLYK